MGRKPRRNSSDEVVVPEWFKSMYREMEQDRLMKEMELMERGRSHFYRENRGRIMAELLRNGKSMSTLNSMLEIEWESLSKEARIEYSKNIL